MELLAAIALIVILALIAVPNLGKYLSRAGEARCAANMRSIVAGLHGYLLDNKNVWPQGPDPDTGPAWEDFWLGTFKPYGIDERTWQCPTTASRSGPEGPQIHYLPTMFPATPGIANRWPTHPWLIEQENAHGNGTLICFPDGSVKSFDKVLAELGVR